MTRHAEPTKRNRIYVQNAKRTSLDLRYPHLGDAHEGSRRPSLRNLALCYKLSAYNIGLKVGKFAGK